MMSLAVWVFPLVLVFLRFAIPARAEHLRGQLAVAVLGEGRAKPT